MNETIRKATIDEALCVAKLAIQMWEENTLEGLTEELAEIIAKPESVVFLLCDGEDVIGFAQCQLRHDYVEGTDSSPVGYLEGIFVEEGNRQELHEVIRNHSMAAGRRVKEEGLENDLLERIKNDPAFAAIREEFDSLINPSAFVGRAPQQVADYLADEVRPLLKAHASELADDADCAALNV